MSRIKIRLLPLLGGLLLAPSLACARISSFPPKTRVATFNGASDFDHQVGERGGHGWELDYKRDRPGYALASLRKPLLLNSGTYRVTFYLRRGHYPQKGLFNASYGVFRLELWDLTRSERINVRELQRADFSAPNKFEARWVEFSMQGREGHFLEPRVYWMGLANGEVEKIVLDRYPEVDLRALQEKAYKIGENLEREHIENGFVVSRWPDGRPDETGDATTYTGFYAASLAWKYAVTRDELTYQHLENALEALHQAVKGTPDWPMIVRYVDDNGVPHPDPTSKDVYTSFFLAYSIAYPFLKNESLKKRMTLEAARIGDRYLQDGLRVTAGGRAIVSLTPYLTDDEIRSGIRQLFENRASVKSLLKNLKRAQRFFPFVELWPGLRKVIRSLKRRDQELLFDLVVPTLNGAALIIDRVRGILREQYRQDLYPKRFRNQNYPGKKLEILLTRVLQQLPREQKGRRFRRASDLKVLGGNALISLHLIRTAQILTGKPEFEEYYRNNLYTQDALLKTALDWYGIDEELLKVTLGNPQADRRRKGYLSTLSLYNLIELETNPTFKARYQAILKRGWEDNRNEDNPLAAAIVLACLGEGEADRGVLLKGLDLYPLNRTGFGEEYWKERGVSLGEGLGGGVYKGFSREPLPISHRPKDSFLWQRSARRLKGDAAKNYPGTEYLFVYWFCRYHGIIPDTPPRPNVKR